MYHLQVLAGKIKPEIVFLLTFERSSIGQQRAGVVTIFAAECSISAKLEQPGHQSCNKRSSCRGSVRNIYWGLHADMNNANVCCLHNILIIIFKQNNILHLQVLPGKIQPDSRYCFPADFSEYSSPHNICS